MRKEFDGELKELGRELTKMGAMCEHLIALAAKAFIDGDEKTAAGIPELGRGVDQMERDIESLCLRLLLRQQPVARDLRQISAALKMITDMERIGDQAEDIADIVLALHGAPGSDRAVIRSMAEAAVGMVTESVDAYVKQDAALAEKVIADDDAVDADFVGIKNYLIKKISENSEDAEFALDLLMVAKYFERIGDHATNIAEWVIFSVTGIHKGEKTE